MHASQIGIPAPFGHVVGVADVISVFGTFPAEIAGTCHYFTSSRCKKLIYRNPLSYQTSAVLPTLNTEQNAACERRITNEDRMYCRDASRATLPRLLSPLRPGRPPGLGRITAGKLLRSPFQKRAFLPVGNDRDKLADNSAGRPFFAIFPLTNLLASWLD